jgi:hypothetical protein
MAPKKDTKAPKTDSKSKPKASTIKSTNDTSSSSKLKAATAINTRHILVRALTPIPSTPTNNHFSAV